MCLSLSQRLKRPVRQTLAPVAALLIVLVFALQVSANAPTDATVITFRVSQPDDAVASLSERHQLRVTALHLGSIGAAGTHRGALPVASLRGALQSARADTISTFENMLRGNAFRLSNFVGRHGESELAGDRVLLEEARSLLRIRSQAAAILAAARDGQPLVYAIEVSGATSSQLDAVVLDPAVAGVQQRNPSGIDMRPDSVAREYRDPAIESIAPRELLRLMVQAVEEAH